MHLIISGLSTNKHVFVNGNIYLGKSVIGLSPSNKQVFYNVFAYVIGISLKKYLIKFEPIEIIIFLFKCVLLTVSN